MDKKHELQSFIAHARKKGMDHNTIRILLLSAGWKERDVVQALTAQELEQPIPIPPDTGGARDAFFHLLTFGVLYTTIFSLISLFFQYIDRLLPDFALASPSSDESLSGIRWSLAALVVAAPLLLWFSRTLLRDIARQPEKVASSVRRWLTYFTLLIASSAIVGTLITVIFSFLEGELSLRFFLKIAVILLIAGCTFMYYFLSLRLHPGGHSWRALHRTFFIVFLVAVTVVLVWGGMLVGSPMSQRLRRFDERRVEDLQTITQEIYNIVYEGKQFEPVQVPRHPIPTTLEAVQQQALYQRPDIVDPQTGVPYTYAPQSNAFRLCATFETQRDTEYDVRWNHPAGEHCFSFDIEDRSMF